MRTPVTLNVSSWLVVCCSATLARQPSSMMGTQSSRPQAMAMVIAFISTLLIMAYMKLSRVYIRE